MDLLRILPSYEELSSVDLPHTLSFSESVQRQVDMAVACPDKPAFDLENTKHLDDFFKDLGDPRPATAQKKFNSRRSLENLSSSNSSSKRGSMSLSVDEFPMALLQDNVQRINQLTSSIHAQIAKIRGIESEKEEFSRLIEELGESVARWSEKTEMLAEKGKAQPNYEVADDYISRKAKTNLEDMELLIRNLKAKKSLETKLGELLPDPEVTAETMSNIKHLVSEFINDDSKMQF